MQRAITLVHNGLTLRGMEHIPEHNSNEKLPAVILFHGFTGTKLEPHRLFLKISRALENIGFASFRFDFLGSGESDGNFEEMTVSGEIEEAHAILDFVKKDARIDSKKISVIGLSMGGLVASVLAGDRKNDIEKLVLMAPAGNMYELIEESAKVFQAYPDLPVIDYDGNLIGRQFSEDLKTINVFDRAKEYEKDVLIIHGTKDPTVPFETSNLYQQKSYDGRAIIHPIEEGDHTFNKFEWEKEVIETICSFVK